MLSDPFITILTAITGNHSGQPRFARYLRPGAVQHFLWLGRGHRQESGDSGEGRPPNQTVYPFEPEKAVPLLGSRVPPA